MTSIPYHKWVLLAFVQIFEKLTRVAGKGINALCYFGELHL